MLFPEPLGIQRSVCINCLVQVCNITVEPRYLHGTSAFDGPARQHHLHKSSSLFCRCLAAMDHFRIPAHQHRNSWRPEAATRQLCDGTTFLGFTVSYTEGESLTPFLCCKLLNRCMVVCLDDPDSSRLPCENMLHIFLLFGNIPSERKQDKPKSKRLYCRSPKILSLFISTYSLLGTFFSFILVSDGYS